MAAQPSVAVCQDILAGIYSSILTRANVPVGVALDAQTTQTGYEAVTHELERIRIEIAKADDTLAVALTNYFGYRDFTNRAGVGAMFTNEYPSIESDQVYGFMREVAPADKNLCIMISRTAIHHVLSIVTNINPPTPLYHMTIPRNPIGMNDQNPWMNFTLHYTDDRTRAHVFHRFNFPQGAPLAQGQIDPVITAAAQLEAAAVQARTAAALAAAPADPASVAKAARAARPVVAAPPPAPGPAPAPPPPPPPPQGPGRPSWRDKGFAAPTPLPPAGPKPRYGRGRKTKRNRRGKK